MNYVEDTTPELTPERKAAIDKYIENQEGFKELNAK
jgi:hypothetical protein